MPVSRTSLVTGPAKITWNSATLYSKDDFDIVLEKDTIPVMTSAHGKVDERATETKAECSFTPEGRWNDALIAAIFTPFANMAVGTSIITGTDRPMVAVSADQTHTIVAAGITKLPDIILSATKTLLGPITFTGVRKLAGDWETADSLYTIGSGASIADATFNPLDIKMQPYLATWGAVSGFEDFETEDGWTISFNLQTEEKKTDSGGILDIRFKSIEIMAKCVPIGPTAAQILANLRMQGTGNPRGHSLAEVSPGGAASPALTITGDDGTDYCVIANAALKSGGYKFGSTVLRNGEIGFVGARTFSSGAQQALFTLDAPA